jgi:hypothetical protein
MTLARRFNAGKSEPTFDASRRLKVDIQPSLRDERVQTGRLSVLKRQAKLKLPLRGSATL